jgi:hypothetical protein
MSLTSTEDMVRLFNHEMQKDHTDELPEERAARLAADSAYKHLDRVKVAKYANGQPMYTWEDRTAAQDDFKEKFDAFNTASGTAARTRYLGKLAADKKAKADAQAAEEAKQQKAAEVNLREQYLTDWKAAGGDQKSFDASWESVRAEHYKRQVLERQAANRAAMLKNYSGRF